jgi:hypothetical protein
MESITVPRTGDLPLAFEGQVIASAGSRLVRGQERNRWHEIELYRTAGGKFVAAIHCRTIWQGEQDHDCAAVLDGPPGIAEYLRTWIPASVIRGYPPGVGYEEKQQRMLATVEADYQSLISEVLAAAGPEFVERVE